MNIGKSFLSRGFMGLRTIVSEYLKELVSDPLFLSTF